jgi:DDE superfamily endonuclease
VEEVTALLAARAPKLRQAVREARKAGHAYVILDGTLIPIDRVAADRPFYSGKHKKHGMNLQVIASPHGDVLWVSGALPGSVHDKKAEWIWGVPDELEKAGLVTLAGQGLPGQRMGEDPVQGQEQARAAERGQPRLREAPRPRRKGKRPAQDLEDPQQATLLSLESRETR